MGELAKREIRANYKSFEKYGEDYTKLFEVGEEFKLRGLKFIKPYYLFLFASYTTLKVVVVDTNTKQVITNQEFEHLEFDVSIMPLSISDELDFCIRNKIFRYNMNTKTYDVIDLGDIYVRNAIWDKDPIRCYIISLYPTPVLCIYDKQTNNIQYFYDIIHEYSGEAYLDKSVNKFYVFYYYNNVREINLSDMSYNDYSIPNCYSLPLILQNPLRFLYVDSDGLIKLYNTETEEIQILKNIKEEWDERAEWISFTPDHINKCLYIYTRARPLCYIYVMFRYSFDDNKLERIGIFDTPYYTQTFKNKDFIAVYDVGWRLFTLKIINIKKKTVVSVISSDESIVCCENIIEVL